MAANRIKLDINQAKTIRFFCEAYDELAQLCSEDDLTNYKVNQISRILRQFLFDDKSVISDVAKMVIRSKYHRKFTFRCSPYIPLNNPSLVFGGIYDGFYPANGMSNNVINVSRQALGSQILLEYQGKPYTLRQLVKYIANKEGGVHFDQSELDVTEKELKEMQDYFWVGGRSALTSTLRAVGLVVLDGLKYTREASQQALNQ